MHSCPNVRLICVTRWNAEENLNSRRQFKTLWKQFYSEAKKSISIRTGRAPAEQSSSAIRGWGVGVGIGIEPAMGKVPAAHY